MRIAYCVTEHATRFTYQPLRMKANSHQVLKTQANTDNDNKCKRYLEALFNIVDSFFPLRGKFLNAHT